MRAGGQPLNYFCKNSCDWPTGCNSDSVVLTLQTSRVCSRTRPPFTVGCCTEMFGPAVLLFEQVRLHSLKSASIRALHMLQFSMPLPVPWAWSLPPLLSKAALLLACIAVQAPNIVPSESRTQ
jgi:hypothetical protein